ncbi:hypothetical protein NA57DRAFT_57595 [Rhizodiscina lignyota]|uniref:BZIP domain-containing protein n=1 Tax=Rhizodiscina lignyota TaxID=1504668 RepID=A0A9P4M8N0_9PEZI|nr:hypothetical protein NA57DRAFT_57595 [Rhizodiscina lignyota]
METNMSLSPIESFLDASSSLENSTAAEMFATSIPSIKIEEPSTSTITPDLLHLPSSSSPAPENLKTESRAVKKRKSWGQVLPEPKTTLPPRKRAKTADEKEQRRIERVKRNRLAAHNSRERKREEMDKLQIVNDGLVAQLAAMQKQMAQLQEELKQFRAGKTPAISSFDFSTTSVPSTSPAMTAVTDANILTTPELGNLDSPMSHVDDFSGPPTPDPEQGLPEQSFLESTQQSAALFETSDFLNILADPGAPLHGSDGSGFGTEAGDFSQLLSLENVGV